MHKSLIIPLTTIFVGLIFFTISLQAQDSVDSEPDISQLIRELGDENYHVRENASEKLKKFGVRAASALQKALQDPDVEIAERSKELLRFVEFNWVRPNDTPPIRQLMDRYAKAHSIQEKLAVINRLSDYTEDKIIFVRKGEAIGALCRILQFEQEQMVRAEAVRTIIAVPPPNPQVRKRWFAFVEEFFDKTEKTGETGEMENDSLVQMVLRFVETRKNALEYRNKTLFEESPTPADEKLIKQVRETVAEFRKFRDNDNYYNGRRGSDYDLLLFYALAELYEAVKLQNELDQLLQEVLDMAPIISSDNIPPYMSRCLVARYLAERHFNLWAKNECLMIAEKDIRLKTLALYMAAFPTEYLGEDAHALDILEQIDKKMADPRAPENAFFSGKPEYIKSRIKHLSAKLAMERGELEQAQKLLDEAIKIRTERADVDVYILRYQLSLKFENEEKQGTEISEQEKKNRDEFKQKTDELIKRSLAGSINEMKAKMDISEPNADASIPYNQTAWLLSNTDGDPKLALDSAKRAAFLSSDEANVIDTLSHAYALAKDYDKAVETQKYAVQLAPQTVIFRDVLKKFEALRDDAAKKQP